MQTTIIYITGIYDTLDLFTQELKNAAKDQEKEDTRFADSVREKSEASGSIVGNSKIGSVSAKFISSS